MRDSPSPEYFLQALQFQGEQFPDGVLVGQVNKKARGWMALEYFCGD